MTNPACAAGAIEEKEPTPAALGSDNVRAINGS